MGQYSRKHPEEFPDTLGKEKFALDMQEIHDKMNSHATRLFMPSAVASMLLDRLSPAELSSLLDCFSAGGGTGLLSALSFAVARMKEKKEVEE